MIGNGTLRICFVALKTYGLLSGRDDIEHIGGAEIQQVLIARDLARRGHSVSFVTHDHGQPDGIEHDGIRVLRMCALSEGVRGLRFVHPRWTSLCKAALRADAEIYYQRGAGAETGQVAAWCRRNRRRFVFAAASDSDCDAVLPYLKSRRERMLYRFGLARADRVIAQTRVQQGRFLDAMGRESILIRSCSKDHCGVAGRTGGFPALHAKRVLWIGRFAVEKRPEMLLDLAAKCPEYQFDVVGASSGDTAVARAFIERAKRLGNVHVHGRVDHKQMGTYFGEASLLLCTSAWEGFPNTFMEAWVYGVPTVSTVDPDDVISRCDLGAIGTNVDALRQSMRNLLDDPVVYQKCSENTRRFFEENHRVTTAVDAYERVFTELVGRH